MLSVLRTLVCLILSMVTLSAVAQQKRDWSFFLYGKMHSFYDPGVYEIGETNNATANGMGMSFAKPISKRVSLFGGYDFALADSLSYSLGRTSNAVFHQLDVNIAVDIFQIWRIQPYIFTGYAWNSIPDLVKLNQRKDGVNINLGGGAKFKLTEAISLGYQMNYRFSISENIPFNFRHQIGLHVTPKKLAFICDSRAKTSVDIDELRYSMDSLASVNDSLRTVLSNASIEGNNISIKNISELEEHTPYIEEDDQQWMEDLQNRSIFKDKSEFSAYSRIDSLGGVTDLITSNLASGYYLYLPAVSDLETANGYRNTLKNVSPKTYVLQAESNFCVLIYVGYTRTLAEEMYLVNRTIDTQIVLVKL